MKKRRVLWGLLWMLLMPVLCCAAGQTEIAWYGQSAFKVMTPGGKVLLIDPWIDNPANRSGKDDLAKLDKGKMKKMAVGETTLWSRSSLR